MWLAIFVILAVCYSSQLVPCCKSLPDICGCEVEGITISWRARTFSSFITQVGTSRLSKMLDYWFVIGSYVCCCMAAFNIVLLCVNLVRLMYDLCFAVGTSMGATSNGGSEGMLLMPLVPGVTLPTSHLPYIVLAAAVALIHHELGHALAATVCHLHLTSFGVALFAFIPSAFVQIEEHVRRISPHKQLRIYTAGAWHNLTQGIIAGVVLFFLPVLLSPLWVTCSVHTGHECVWVSSVKGSVIEGSIPVPNPVAHVGISALNGKQVQSVKGWNMVLNEIASKKEAQRFCVPEAFMNREADDVSCCEEGYSGALLCFVSPDSKVCLPGKRVAMQFWGDDCCGRGVKDHGVCLSLQLQGRSMIFKLDLTTGASAVFIEDIFDINKIRVADYLPTFLPSEAQGLYGDDLPAYTAPLPYWFGDVPFHLTAFLLYLQMISYGLMLVNLIPITGLDGEHVLTCVLHIANEKLCRPPAPAEWDTYPEQDFLETPVHPITVVIDTGHDLDISKEPRKLLGRYGDAGVVDHQLEQLYWHRLLVACGTWLLGLNVVFSFLLLLA